MNADTKLEPISADDAKKIKWDYLVCGTYPCSCCSLLAYTKQNGKEITCKDVWKQTKKVLRAKPE